VAAFIVYGSYVPFDWRERPWDEVTASYRWAMTSRALPSSRSDWAANVALGVPLGFALLGWLRVDRPNRGVAIAFGVAVVAACTAFAAAVEFGQLYCNGRTCSGSDVWAQGLGAAVGVGVWIAGGQWATNKLRTTLTGRTHATTAPLLAGYAGLVLLVQALPLDLTASPADLYRKLRDATTWKPFGDWFASDADPWKKAADWVELIALFLPAGLLATGLPGRLASVNGLGWAAVVGLGGAAVTEAVQVAVVSRHPSSTDVLVGGFGFVFGWAVGLALADRGVKKRRKAVAVGLGAAWAAALAVYHWQPFDFDPAILGEKFGAVEWLPLVNQTSKNYLWGLNELLGKAVVWVPLGAVGVWASRRHHRVSRPWVAAAVCGALAVVFEVGQGMLPSRYVSVTDVLFGVAGGFAGGELTRRVKKMPVAA
jgi:VanZ family protein